MTASLDWPVNLPQRGLEQGFRAGSAERLVDIHPSIPPIYFVRSRALFRKVSVSLRLSFPQRDFFLQQEPTLRGRRFNADFEGLGSTRETIIDDWSLSAIPNGAGFILSLSVSVFDTRIALVVLAPTSGEIRYVGGIPTLTQTQE